MTVTQLSQLDSGSIGELEAASNEMQSYIRARSNEVRQAAIEGLDRKNPILRRLFPTAQDREFQRLAVQGMRQIAESQSELLALYTATQIEIAKIKADALIAAQGMQTRTVLARFANEKIHELSSTLNGSRREFLGEMRPQFEMLETYKDLPELYKPAYESVIHQIDTYFETTKRLLDGFTSSLNNKAIEAVR